MRKNKLNKVLITMIILLIYIIMKQYVSTTHTLDDDVTPDVTTQMLADDDS